MRISSPSEPLVSFYYCILAAIVLTVWRNYAQSGAEESDRVLNGGVTLGLVQAVTARLIECAESVCIETSDVVLSSKRVVLEDLVGSIESTTSDNTELSVQTLGSQSILADIFPPD